MKQLGRRQWTEDKNELFDSMTIHCHRYQWCTLVLILSFLMDTARIYILQTAYSKLQYQCGSFESSLWSEIIQFVKIWVTYTLIQTCENSLTNAASKTRLSSGIDMHKSRILDTGPFLCTWIHMSYTQHTYRLNVYN